MFTLARLQSAAMLGLVVLVGSAAAASSPRKLLQDTSPPSSPEYNGFFDKDRPSECGFTCRVVAISVGGGLLLLALLSFCICCCCRCRNRGGRKQKAQSGEVAAVPYNYTASPAIATTAKSDTSGKAAYAPVTTGAPAPAFGGALATSKTGRPATTTASNYTAPQDAYAARPLSTSGSGIGRNTMPGTYNPRKF